MAPPTQALPSKLLVPWHARSIRRRAEHALASLLVFIAFVIPAFVPTVIAVYVGKFGDEDDCAYVEAFSAGSLLAPDVTAGNYNLVAVRAIDLSWNLIMGRILPFVLAWVSYNVGAMAITRIAEQDFVTYEAFASVTLNAHSLPGLLHMSKEIVRLGSKRAKATIGVLIFSTVYLLALPTLIDTESGYVRNQSRVWSLPDGSIDTSSCSQPQSSGQCLIQGQLASPLCVDGDGYRWGVSWLLFIITHGLMFIWALLMFLVWRRSMRPGTLTSRGRSMGLWRAVVDLGVAIRRDLGANVDAYSDEELGSHIAECAPLQYSIRMNSEPEDHVILVPASKLSSAISKDEAEALQSLDQDNKPVDIIAPSSRDRKSSTPSF